MAIRVKRGKDRRIFAKTARRTHKKNIIGHTVMRGGIRL